MHHDIAVFIDDNADFVATRPREVGDALTKDSAPPAGYRGALTATGQTNRDVNHAARARIIDGQSRVMRRYATAASGLVGTMLDVTDLSGDLCFVIGTLLRELVRHLLLRLVRHLL